MSSSHNSMDALVDAISQKVAARLQLAPEQLGTGGSYDPGADPSEPCYADENTCTGCGFCVTRKAPVVDRLIDLGIQRVGAGPGGKRPNEHVASIIDHTLLKPDVTQDQLRQVCEEAVQWGFATVCVNAVNIPYVARLLDGSGVKPIAVVGFPLGASTGAAKAFEAREAIRNGAKEIDTVINIGALKSRDYGTVLEDLAKTVNASKPYPVKVILETTMLTQDEKVIACSLSKASGAAFVKTSTGFGGGGATVDDVALMRRIVGDDMQVKASGGVRSMDDAKAIMEAGADRIGASASVAIVSGKTASGSY